MRQPRQSNKVLELDSEIIEFVFENPHLIEPKKKLYSIIYSTELIPKHPITLRRDIVVLSKDLDGLPHVLFAAWFDVTELYGTNSEVLVNVKGFSDNKQEHQSVRLELNEKLNSIFSPQLNLTKREKEILHLISEGKTSEQIADSLNISKKTVDKHRQNIIKNNNISNTSAILRSL
jgi:DNA-binding CsgD family transcriptional regulator